MAEWPNTFWAERIEIGLSREFSAALQSELPGWTVCESVCGDVAADVSIKLDLVRLDYLQKEGRLKAVARIWVDGKPAGTPAAHAERHAYAELDVPVTPDTAEAQAATFSSLLHELAKTGAALAVGQREAPGVTTVRPSP